MHSYLHFCKFTHDAAVQGLCIGHNHKYFDNELKKGWKIGECGGHSFCFNFYVILFCIIVAKCDLVLN